MSADAPEVITWSEWINRLGRCPEHPLTDESIEVVIRLLAARMAYPQASEDYLSRVARNARLNHRRSERRQAYRRSKHRPLPGPKDKNLNAAEAHISESMIARDLAETILTRAEDLKTRALLMLLAGGATLADAAKTCGLSQRTAERRLAEVRTRWEETF